MNRHVKDCLLVVSVSGGKDSAAMSLWLKEQGLEHERVFADTGWEHDWTYEYLRGPLTKALGPITEVGLEGGMAGLIRKKGLFPSRVGRYCTEELKVKPIAKYLAKRQEEQDREVVNVVGIRAGESEARSKMPMWEWSESLDCWVWRPLLNWTTEDVVAIHQRHGLKPNPLYTTVVDGMTADRVGCFPCIFARKAEIRMVAAAAPGRIDLIRTLEGEVSAAAEARGSAHPKYGSVRTFFAGKITRDMSPLSIDDAVKWSRTAHGGKDDLVVSEDEQPEGCMRWGFCEKAPSVLDTK